MLTDEALIKQLHRGNHLVFREIFNRYYFPLRSFASRYIENDEVTEDFVQDAFVKVWEKKSDFILLASLRSYLYASVKNACLDYLRHKQMQLRHASDLTTFFSESDEEEFKLEEEVHALIYETIKGLSVQSRRVVLMTMEGYSNPEIAEKLQISPNTVKTLKLRAYRTLRERLSGVHWLMFLLLYSPF
ncbi:RNA polymerase sigma-70 factor [Gabonibacter massiliensis]|uniref:RNA polymerase sigma-70 factor n=1 Tax=Gabonibacter massiliensis TaxID=1720195 RepID=UPI00256FA78C|nr:RNA polymerase sigma-70 factor [Gabonibacter massiliensis]